MKRYAALLRGVNISGKNKVPMAELRQGLEKLGFSEVKTYLNSGNAVFSGEDTDTLKLAILITEMIHDKFDLDIPVFVISLEELNNILRHAPEWWGSENREIYDNLIFIMPPTVSAEVYREIGAPKEGLERIEEYGSAIFWSFSRKDYQKTNWWSKTAGTVGGRLTIRTANTVRKIAVL